jgi:hypothetical protein
MYWALANREACEPMRTHIAVFPAEIAQRSTSPSIGGRVRIAVKPTDEVRVYCADRLVARCHAGSSKNGCASDARGVVAEVPLTDSGEYRVVVVNTVTAEPVGDLVRDLEAIVAAGGEYQLTELPVH